MRNERFHFLGILPLAIAVSISPGLADDLRVSHLYNLSDFSGTIPFSYASLHTDREHDETYVLYQNVVRIFNASGMEVFRFGNADEGGVAFDLTVGESGEIYTLVRDLGPGRMGSSFFIRQRNYRGEPLATILPEGLPVGWTDFVPVRIFHRQGRLLLVDTARLLAAETDTAGKLLRAHDLGEMLGIAPEERPDTQISGFDWDGAGNMLLTIPVAFRAFVVSPEGTVESFGRGGSVPGTFGIAAGITSDERGLYYVADKLRSVVMIFDADYGFLTEFGYRGRKPENLIAPNSVVIGDSGKLHVTQLGNRGVAVFAVHSGGPTELDSAQARNRKEASQERQGFFQQELFNSPGDDRLAVNPDLRLAGTLGGPPLGGG